MTNPPSPEKSKVPAPTPAPPAQGGSQSSSPAPGLPHIRIEMRSCPKYLAGARELVATLSRRVGFNEIGACQIALAVDEALANVIRHGYDRREDQPIWMSIWEVAGPPGCSGCSGLRVVIEDLGRQTDPSQIKGRDLDDVRPGGLGVHIIREVMDEVVYEKRAEGGMRLTLVKRPDPAKDGMVAGSQGESNG